MLWSLHCFVLFSFVFNMNYHLYFIWIVIHCSYTEAIMFLIFGLLLLKKDFMYFVYFMCVEVMCVHRATWENSQWLNVLPCINILEIDIYIYIYIYIYIVALICFSYFPNKISDRIGFKCRVCAYPSRLFLRYYDYTMGSEGNLKDTAYLYK